MTTPNIQNVIQTLVTKYINTTGSHLTCSLHHDLMTLVEKSLIQMVLSQTANNKSEASRMLGISRMTLNKKIKKYKLTIA